MYKYNMGGTVPRETTIGGQRHNLAYINPFEEDLLNTQYRGGEGQSVPPNVGPGGVPAYNPNDQGQKNVRQTQSFNFGSSGSNRDEHDRRADRAAAESQARTNQMYAALTAGTLTFPTTTTTTPATQNQVRSVQQVEAATRLRNAQDLVNEGATSNVPVTQRQLDGVAPLTASQQARSSLNAAEQMNMSGPTDATPQATGLQKFFNEVKAIPGNITRDISMGVAAGFGDRAAQRVKLLDADYTRAEIDAYFQRTDDTIARNAANPMQMDDGDGDSQAGVGVGGIDPFAFTGVGGGGTGKAAADPCPEGFIMDPATNACVPMDDTNSGYLGLPSYVTPDPSVPLTDFSQPAVLGQPNLQPYAPISSGTGGNFIQGSNRNNFNQGGPVGGIMDLLR